MLNHRNDNRPENARRVSPLCGIALSLQVPTDNLESWIMCGYGVDGVRFRHHCARFGTKV